MAAEEEYNKILIGILQQETSPEAVKAKNMILRRMATENQVTPSRIPQPLNITEIGGYINLLEKLNHTDLQYGTLASILGQPHKASEAEFYDTSPITFFSEYVNDRPSCNGAAEIPLTLAIRSDFSMPFMTMLSKLHKEGASLPILAPKPQLPSIGYVPSEREAMEMIGRVIEIAPSAVMNDPATDPIVSTNKGLFVRGGSEEKTVDAFTADGKTKKTTSKFIHLDPILAQAGWYPSPDEPTVLINATGLVRGRTRYGDELSRVYTGSQITASGVRELVPRIWNGTAFEI